MSDARLDDLERATRLFHGHVPLNAEMGMEIGALGDGTGSMRLPWDPRWLGDPEHGLVHGGVLTALLDAACGLAAFMALRQVAPIATLDLRVDHFRPAEAGRDVIALAETVRRTRQVLFVRAVAHHGDTAAPVAVATATFAVTA